MGGNTHRYSYEFTTTYLRANTDFKKVNISKILNEKLKYVGLFCFICIIIIFFFYNEQQLQK